MKTERFAFKREPDNGMLIGPNGCHYDTEAEAFYYDHLQLCGCGRPSEVHRLIIDCLKASSADYPQLLDLKKITEIVKDRADIVAEFIVHFFGTQHLVDHGTSVNGAWLTDRGTQFVEAGAMQEPT